VGVLIGFSPGNCFPRVVIGPFYYGVCYMLHRRNRVYSARVLVPADLQSLIRRDEIIKSLRTSELQEARLRLLITGRSGFSTEE
jgi:hypothetical protein